MKQNTNEEIAAKLPEKSLHFFAIGLIFIALNLFLSFAPGVTRGWGLNYIAFFDPWVIGLFYVLLVCFLLPSTNHYLVAQITAISRQSIVATLRKHRYALFVLISLCAVGCFNLLRTKYILLGDLQTRITHIEDGVSVRDEYLTMLSLNRLYVWLHAHFNFTGFQTVRLVDYITGGLFVFFALCTANLLGNTFLKKAAVFILSTLSCTILLQFCGYNDVYMCALLFLQIYLFTSLLYLKNKMPLIVPALIIFTGIAFHLMLVSMLPSLIFLLYGKVLWKYPLFRNKITIAILVLISLPLLYLAFEKIARPIMLPLASADRMTVFSIAHYKEFFNGQLLGGGIGFLIWLMLLIYSVLGKIKYNFTTWFFFVASLSIVGMMFVFYMDRGSGDWDIAAFAAVVFNLSNASVLLMGGGVQAEGICKNLKYGILMLAGFSICHTSMWILTQKTDASIKYVTHAVITDPATYYMKIPNAIALSYMLYDNHLDDLFIDLYNNTYFSPHYPKPRYNYARALIRTNRQAEGYRLLEQLIIDFPDFLLTYPTLVEHYLAIRDYDASYKLLVQMVSFYEQNPANFVRVLSPQHIDECLRLLAELRKRRAAPF
ncbi:hypothetical protein AGMMS4957_19760 [Bacteroidia bacterium]|nr:hypothetical protein AGMMS4957_19760 [Bacteroidia bacterium]